MKIKHSALRTTLKTTTVACLASIITMQSGIVNADASKGKFYADFRLRYETVDQDNMLKDADALTLRTKLGYVTPSAGGFSGTIEVENSESLIDDFSVPPSNVKKGEFSVIADPDHTEIDQGFVQYKSDVVTGKLGRQVLTLDNHRFVGHVGWRQDRQTFDALSVVVTPAKGTTLTAAYLDKRNRIFSDDADIDSKDILLNASYATPVGKITAYAYLLEVDNGSDNALDTYGVRFSGGTKGPTKFLYTAEFATQESESGAGDFDADYVSLEAGIGIAGITAKLGYESLGSDDGAYGFSTPLATLHKFNGWTDQFLGTPSAGLEDVYLSVGGKIGGGKWKIVYHDFSADDAAGSDDLGDEIDFLYARKFGKTYSGGIKYGAYSAGDESFGKVDTDKLWIWMGAKF